MNINFIKEVLMSKSEYWVVARKRNDYDQIDQIILIVIPKGIKRGLKYEEITLQDVEKLHGSYIEQNVFINTDYPPFQQYISFSDMYKGYPINSNIKEFMIKALELESDDIYQYKALIEQPCLVI